MHFDIIIYSWQIKTLYRGVSSCGIEVVQGLHYWLWGVPEGPTTAMTKPQPFPIYGFYN